MNPALLLPAVAAAALALSLLTHCGHQPSPAPVQMPIPRPASTGSPDLSVTAPRPSQPPEQVPGPLGALLVLSGWAWSRRLRKRIHGGR
jgi:hypothetical protein